MTASRIVPVVFVSLLCVSSAVADELDDYIKQQMRRRNIPGLSLAIIDDGKIVKASGYGFTAKVGGLPVTTATLFQAASISKPIAAVTALHLVEQGKLSLDDDVNARLKTWKVPDNEFTDENKVTLRRILSHSAGLTVQGFSGYAVGEPIPSLLQILNGELPANSAAVRVDIKPGSQWRYSGGGFTVLQQLLSDVTGKGFAELAQETVLKPFGMTSSVFQQPLVDADKLGLAATGYYPDRSEVPGRWHNMPELAAAGLWTTPSDLARFAIGIQQSLSGGLKGVLSPQMAKQMLTKQEGDSGLGVFVTGSGRALRFHHGGENEGFNSVMIAYSRIGKGAVFMTNANDNSRIESRILDKIGERYRWPDFPRNTQQPARQLVHVDAEVLSAYAGRYEYLPGEMLTFRTREGRLFTQADGVDDEEFVPESESTFASTERDAKIVFVKDSFGAVNEMLWKDSGQPRTVNRVGPLIHSLTQAKDPNPVLTRELEVVLKEIARGRMGTEALKRLSAGARRDFTAAEPSLNGALAISFISAQDISGRGMIRHGGAVSRIVYYQLTTGKASRNVLVYLDADGLLTDFDVVDD